MSNTTEIETALTKLPLQEAREVAHWLQTYLNHQPDSNGAARADAPSGLPDYAARRRKIFGDKVLPNMVTLAREQERW